MKKVILSLVLVMNLIGCGDEAQFEGVNSRGDLPEPKTVFLCQYDENGKLLRKVEFEAKDVDLFKEKYSFVDCKESSIWQIKIEPITLPEVKIGFDR